MGITEHKLKHSLSVARVMYEKALQLGYDNSYAEEMFTLGYLHDIGYEYTKDVEKHPIVGGELLKKTKYKYWKEVYYHGTINEYQSFELDLLNYADLMVDSKGKIVGFKERLEDIKKRYGDDSIQYKNSYELIKFYKNF